MRRNVLTQIGIGLVFGGLACLSWAADDETLLRPQFMFKHQSITLGNPSIAQGSTDILTSPTPSQNERASTFGKLNQYDATFSYPFTPRSSVNLDLGINLRFLDGALNPTESGAHHFNATLPMFYANALFNLPYEGWSASLGASHFVYDQYLAFDYKAKLSYQWQNGLGLEGGWQHQLLNIDGADVQAEYENKGPFLDLKYRF